MSGRVYRPAMRPHAPWLIAIGASGSGKTVAVEALEARRLPWLRCYHFDDIGVPTIDEMERQYGSQDAWQEGATRTWIAAARPR